MRHTIRLVAAGAVLAVGAVASSAGASTANRPERVPVGWHAQSGNVPFSPVSENATAKLVRRADGISFSLHTDQLRPGDAYTVWIVTINNPSACLASPCSGPDIMLNPATRSQVTYGAGRVARKSGEANFRGILAAGPVPEGWFSNQGLDDPLGAEVHLVVNDHGPVLAGYIPEMIQTYRAGCTDASIPAFFPAAAFADGTPGPNTCRLWQVAVFGN